MVRSRNGAGRPGGRWWRAGAGAWAAAGAVSPPAPAGAPSMSLAVSAAAPTRGAADGASAPGAAPLGCTASLGSSVDGGAEPSALVPSAAAAAAAVGCCCCCPSPGSPAAAAPPPPPTPPPSPPRPLRSHAVRRRPTGIVRAALGYSGVFTYTVTRSCLLGIKIPPSPRSDSGEGCRLCDEWL